MSNSYFTTFSPSKFNEHLRLDWGSESPLGQNFLGLLHLWGLEGVTPQLDPVSSRLPMEFISPLEAQQALQLPRFSAQCI